LRASVRCDERVSDIELRVHCLPTPSEAAEQTGGFLQRFSRTVRVLLLDERESAQVGDPAQPRFTSQLSQKTLAFVEQAPSLDEIWLIEAQDAKRPFDLNLVRLLTREREGLVGICPACFGVAEV